MRIFRNVENLKNFKCVTSHTNATFLIYYAIAIKEAVTNRRMKNSPGEVSGRDCECRLKYCPANMLKHDFSGDTYEKGFKIPSQHNISKRSFDVSYFAGSNHIKTRFHRDLHFWASGEIDSFYWFPTCKFWLKKIKIRKK